MKYDIKLNVGFQNGLKFIKNFVSKSQSRPILTGFSVNIKEGKVSIYATDSYKLIDVIIGEIEDKTIVYVEKAFPIEIIDLVLKIMKKSMTSIFSIDTDNNRVSFRESANSPEYSVTALYGNYPKIDNLFNGIDNEIEIKKEWYQEFVYKFINWELYPTLQIKIKESLETIHFQLDNFNFVFNHLKGNKGKIFHSNSIMKSILLTFDSDWKYRIMILPVRVGE